MTAATITSRLKWLRSVSLATQVLFILFLKCPPLKPLKLLLQSSTSAPASTLTKLSVGRAADFPDIFTSEAALPLLLTRPQLNLSFAVYLMRSSYNAADELDYMPMDEFQKDFFLFRQNQWLDYKNDHPSIVQGDLADPAYFDFISFAQYAVISTKMNYPKLEFVEKVSYPAVEPYHISRSRAVCL